MMCVTAADGPCCKDAHRRLNTRLTQAFGAGVGKETKNGSRNGSIHLSLLAVNALSKSDFLQGVLRDFYEYNSSVTYMQCKKNLFIFL
jgi:hypothetical protein